MNIFVICSRSLLNLAYPHEHVEKLEHAGHTVYAPWRDTPQNRGLTARQICEINARAIANADAVHVFWDGASHGALLDMGAAIALGKPLINCFPASRTPKAWDLLDDK